MINNIFPYIQITIIMGDFRAKIGQGRHTVIVGGYGLVESINRCETIEVLYEFYQDTEMVISNIWFQLQTKDFIHGLYRAQYGSKPTGKQ